MTSNGAISSNGSNNNSSGIINSSSNNNTQLDGVVIIRQYVDRILHSTPGMKVLLLDSATTQIVSAVYSQTEILEQQVYLISTLLADTAAASSGASSSNKSHLKAVCLLRPTLSNVNALCHTLTNNPVYPEYHIIWTAPLPQGLLRKLAESDVRELVASVREHYADFLPLAPDLWTLPYSLIDNTSASNGNNNNTSKQGVLGMTVAAGTSWAPQHAVQYERHVQGVTSMLLAAKRTPFAVRYAKASPCAEELANDVAEVIADDFYHFKTKKNNTTNGSTNSGGLLLLILDRRDDPVTPLLSQWTYQAMVHELLGLNNHRVVLKGAPGVAKDLQEVVLSAASDEFFRNNRHKNFGELGESIQSMLHEYQTQTARHSAENLNSIEDMQIFMDKFPELKSRSHTVSKHVAIMGELARLVGVCGLLDVSQFEQALACQDDHAAHWRELLDKMAGSAVKVPDKLRLGLLYAIRYETSCNLHMLQQHMQKGGVPPDMVALVPCMLRYGGIQARGPNLFFEQQRNNVVARMTKNIVGAVQGVDNVYAQHVPLVMDTIQSAVRGKLSRSDYPVVTGSTRNNGNSHHAAERIPDEIIIFMVGGVTYEEAQKVTEFNAQQQGRCKVVLAGSTVHNSTSFLDELKATSM